MIKENKKSLMIIGIALLLIVAGLVLIFTGNNNSFNKKDKSGDNNDNLPPDNPDLPPVILVFTKSDVMSIIYEQKALNGNDESWYVGDTALLAHNSDNTKYLIRYKRVLGNGSVEEFESIVEIKEDGQRTIDLPGWSVDSKNLDEFGFSYYVEGSEGYDPINQQYNNIDVGWDPGESNWDNYQYVPDNSWQQ